MPDADCARIPYTDTGYFSRLVIDLLQGKGALKPFAHAALDENSLQEFVARRNRFPIDRTALVDGLKKQYQHIEADEKVHTHIAALRSENTYTITTAHQPNLATGPLYVVYKILHAIRLTEWCNEQMPECRFVPVLYVGSEDADQEELNHFTVEGKKYEWESGQQGAVGRMNVNAALVKQWDELENQIGRFAHGREWVSLLQRHYRQGVTIENAFFGVINELFGRYGLVVVLPDNAAFKNIFLPVVQKELSGQFSSKAVAKSLEALQKAGYKVQAGGRDINLFWLEGNRRQRILAEDEQLKIDGADETYTVDALLEKGAIDPRVWSPNVILRPVFQEMLLPNIAFVGGGGELAYWLELKGVFDEMDVPFPALTLRNSFALVEPAIRDKWAALGLTTAHYFLPDNEAASVLVRMLEGDHLSLQDELATVSEAYERLETKVAGADITLATHTQALKKKALDKLSVLEKKMIRQAKRRQQVSMDRLQAVKNQLFPGGGLQERKENLAHFYAAYGPEIIDTIYQHTAALPNGFCVVNLAS